MPGGHVLKPTEIVSANKMIVVIHVDYPDIEDPDSERADAALQDCHNSCLILAKDIGVPAYCVYVDDVVC